MVCTCGGCMARDVSGCVYGWARRSKQVQGTSASEGHRAANINCGGRDGGGQNVDIVGLTCRSDGWAESKQIVTQFASGSVRRCPAACLMQSGLATRPACSCSRVPSELAVLDSVACRRVGTTGERLGRVQSAACSPVMHLVYCSLSVGLLCSPRLVLHVPWLDLAARLLRVWDLDGMKLTKSWRRSCRGLARSILAAPAAMLCCRGQLAGLGISLTGPGCSGRN